MKADATDKNKCPLGRTKLDTQTQNWEWWDLKIKYNSFLNMKNANNCEALPILREQKQQICWKTKMLKCDMTGRHDGVKSEKKEKHLFLICQVKRDKCKSII